MRTLLLFAIIATLIYACGNATDTTTSNPSSLAKTATEKAPDGEGIYKKYCIACHGLYGDMGASGAYNLKESKLGLEERVAVITNGRNAMTAFEKLLKEKEIQAVAEYSMTLAKD